MKRLLPVLMGFALLLLSSTVGGSFAKGVWLEIKNNPNCFIWNPEPQPPETASWSGPCVNGKAHGKGVLRWRYKRKDKWVEDVFEGEHKDGKMNGHGTYTYGPKSKWAGDKYVGEYRDGKRNGQGTYTFANGDKYVGEWKDGEMYGYGTHTSPSTKASYAGGWKDGKKHGQSTYIDIMGNKYVGEFKDDKRHGQGTYIDIMGNKYVGEFKDGEPHGYGNLTSPSTKASYVGEFKDGKRHGQGTHIDIMGNKYVGEFKDGKRHGQGIIKFDNGDKYVGEFKGNLQNGQGTVTWANGVKYAGGWKDGKKHGLGTFTSADGSGSKVKAENDKLTWLDENSTSSIEQITKELEKLVLDKIRRERDLLNEEKKLTPKVTPKKAKPETETPFRSRSGSGFFVSRMGHVITNAHVVKGCKRITIGDNANKQTTVNLVFADRNNDLALLKFPSDEKDSKESKSLIAKLGVRVVPLASHGLLRSNDVELGEKVMVAGYPFGPIFSNTIKVTTGIVSATRGIGDDSGQFQLDAAVQSGNSGGPIYDQKGNVVGVVVSQLNKLKMAKALGVLPENVNFGIKAKNVRQFLDESGLPTKWSTRSASMSTKELAKIAKKQTLMVMCHR